MEWSALFHENVQQHGPITGDTSGIGYALAAEFLGVEIRSASLEEQKRN